MTVLFFISLGWCQAETKGPRLLVTSVAETFIDEIIILHVEFNMLIFTYIIRHVLILACRIKGVPHAI